MSVQFIQSGRFGTAGAFDPLSLSPVWWLDASDAATITLNGSNVAQWNDKSGLARHISQGTAANQPAYTTAGQNGLNVVTFDSNDMLNSVTFTQAQPIKAFVVAKSTTNTGQGTAFEGTGNTPALYRKLTTGEWSIFAGTVRNSAVVNDFAVHQFSATFNGASSDLRLDGTSLLAAGNAGSTGFTAESCAVGALASGANYWVGFIAEILWYGTLTAPQSLQVEAYLRAKWATP